MYCTEKNVRYAIIFSYTNHQLKIIEDHRTTTPAHGSNKVVLEELRRPVAERALVSLVFPPSANEDAAARDITCASAGWRILLKSKKILILFCNSFFIKNGLYHQVPSTKHPVSSNPDKYQLIGTNQPVPVSADLFNSPSDVPRHTIHHPSS